VTKTFHTVVTQFGPLRPCYFVGFWRAAFLTFWLWCRAGTTGAQLELLKILSSPSPTSQCGLAHACDEKSYPAQPKLSSKFPSDND